MAKSNIVKNAEGKLMLSQNVYAMCRNEEPADSNVDVLSLLGVLSENADLFLEKDEKKKSKAMLRYMYTQNELNKICAKNKVKDVDALIDQVQKYKGTFNYPAEIAPVVNNLNDMKEYINTVITNKDLSANLLPPGREHAEDLRLLQTGALGLVKNILALNNSTEFADIQIYRTKLAPIKKSETISDAKAEEIYKSTLAHVKKFYGYNVVGTKMTMEAERLSGSKLVCHLNDNKLSNSVNILYNTAKQLKGSKNISFITAKQFIDVKDKSELKALEQAFNEKKEIISEAVSTMSTLFVSRFVFDKNTYFDVNKQLSMQLAYKLRPLVFSTDGKNEEDPSIKDAWLIKYLKNRVMQNVTEVVAKNGIHSAQELAKIYAINGTKAQSPNDILNIEDFVFSTQLNSPEPQKEQFLENSVKNNTVGTIKNNKELLKRVENETIKNLLKQKKYYEIYENAYNKKYKEVLDELLKQKAEEPVKLAEELDDLKDTNIENQDDVNKLLNQKLTTEQTVEVVKAQAEINAKDDAIETVENILSEEQANVQKAVEEQAEELEDDYELGIASNVEEIPTPLESTQETLAENDTLTPVVLEEMVEQVEEPEETVEEPVEEKEPEETVEEIEIIEEKSEGEETKALATYHTEEKPTSPEEYFNGFKKIYKQILKGKNVIEALNLRMTDNKRVQTNKQLNAAKKTREFMTEQIATVLAEKTFVYYAKARKSKNINISDRPRAIVSCYCNEELLGKSIFYSGWRSQTNKWLAVTLATECNKLLNDYGLEYAIDENTYKKVTSNQSFKTFEKDLQDYRQMMSKEKVSEDPELEA